jgi:hypothetical protein
MFIILLAEAGPRGNNEGSVKGNRKKEIDLKFKTFIP